ncbi:MAG: hypothetical protein LBD99_05250, partial [Candidatus Margulisbacteria bacterium]|nr:hypothetical protein [Candidatus Margulisiibacteriota bacterium]
MSLDLQDIQSLYARIAAAGIASRENISAQYLAVAEEMGLCGLNSADNSSLRDYFRLRTDRPADDSAYIYNLKDYDIEGRVSGGTDSYYLVSYNGEQNIVDAAFGYADLTGGYNSVDTYIDPYDPAIARLLADIPGLDDPKLSTEEKLAKLYNYIIDNFNYVAEDKDDWNFAAETIFARGGDCEDLSILLASAMIALLMQEGMDYQTANSRVSAVAGKHAVYGDHVFVEYLADDGNTYALDPSFAEEGKINKLSDLKQIKDLQFTVYFRFNDNQVFGSSALSAEDSISAYID